jgi:aminoglycoside phosphotransferase (APT) family kinase protein
MNGTATGIDLDALESWFARVTDNSGELAVTPIHGGGSCEMFRIDRLEQSWVLRRAPLAAVSATAHQVIREAQIIGALGTSQVPVPTVLATCEDAAVLGAPFFVMSHVDGTVIRRSGLPAEYLARPQTQPAIGEQLMDVLVDLHAVDWRTNALAELARPEPFLPRQVERWMSQLATYRFRELADVDRIAQWLDTNLPADGELTLMHGDYKIDNVMWTQQAPPRILSVLDFEMTTIGDPLIDLAWALTFWPEEGNLISLAAPGSTGGLSAEYCQTPTELATRYADATGRDLTCFDWYQAFSAWKLAIVLEASYAKFVSGKSSNPSHEIFGFVVDQLLVRAGGFAR